MAAKSPVAKVKELFESKEKLVKAVQAFVDDDKLWLGRLSKGEKGLQHVSNAKLLRLHATFTEVKKSFGSREKLIAQILAAEGRDKDAGLKKRYEAFPLPRLFDVYKSVSKRAKAKKAVEKA